MAEFSVDFREVDGLMEQIQKAENSERIINEVIHGYGKGEIEKEIVALIPASGRTWKGKKPAASSTMPFKDKDINLGVDIKNKPPYGYLYFVDDGENTRKHIGNRRFMERGTDNASGKVLDRVQEEIIRAING